MGEILFACVDYLLYICGINLFCHMVALLTLIIILVLAFSNVPAPEGSGGLPWLGGAKQAKRKYQRSSVFVRGGKKVRRAVENDYTAVNEILRHKAGFRAESTNVSILDPVKAKITSRLPLGTEVAIVDDDCLRVMINGRPFSSVFFGLGSNVPNIIRTKRPYSAYITDRDSSCSSDFYDFFTVTVFY